MDTARVLRTEFRAALAAGEDRVLLLGRRVQQAVGLAMTSLEAESGELCQQILETDDQVDLDCHQLEHDIFVLMNLQSPMARDLRLLVGLQKVLGNIQRIGDGAVNIARLGADLVGLGGSSTELLAQMHELGRRAERAVRTGLDSFGHRRDTVDSVGAVEDQIDLLHDGLTARLIQHATLGRAQTEWAIRMVLVSRHLERIGDHAVKIAEEGAFVATGHRPSPVSRH
ncbi:MAG: phosphate signaling complex PhoU family protein [Euzebya sp.]